MLMSSISSIRPTITTHLRFNPLKPIIDNFVFKLHYRITVILLLFACVMVCAREYFGDHIKCMADKGVPEHVINTYCFFMATFTIVRHYNESLLEAEILPHPGVGPILDTDDTLHHTYYQWVPFALFLQAICFYVPHYVWKKKEGGRIKALVDGLQLRASLAFHNDEDIVIKGDTIPSLSTLDKRLEIIRKDIILRLQITRTWSFWLVGMEVANLLHLILQIWLTDLFLNGHFISLGPKIMHGDFEDIADPLETVFPKVTKCLFHKYGPSGSLQQHDALCVMALNIVHEKIYSVLWFWFLLLLILSVLAVIWRLISWCVYRHPRFTKFNALFFWQPKISRPGDESWKLDPQNVIRVVNGCQFGDWLFLYYLAKNMNGFVFQQLFTRLAEELAKKEVADNEDEDSKGAEPVLISHSKFDYDDETLPLKGGHKIE